MKKPEMEIIRFENEDVITTSAQPSAHFKFSGFFDGTPGNLTMIFNGEDKTGKGAEVLSYLTKNYGSFDWIGFEGIFQSIPGLIMIMMQTCFS